MSGPRIGELFAGYGGLGMGVQAALGGEMAWYSEIDKGALKILEHRFPDVPNVGDITTVDWSQVEPVDILTGGSPCQDLSHAGRRAGMTEGTRSNLWVAMRETIAQLRPGLVIWENVRGAYSAEADSDLVNDPRLLADTRRRDGEPVLRALGRVLGDLSELGYVGGWHGLRAADVGAPHGRFRVFVVATDAERLGGSEGGRYAGLRAPRAGASGLPDIGGRRGTLLPTPTSSDTNGAGAHGDGGLDLRTTISLLSTPAARAAKGCGPVGSASHQWLLAHGDVEAEVLSLLPTPAVNDMGAAYTPDEWDAWTDRMKAEHGNGNGHGKSLNIEAQRLLPTPTAQDAAASGGSSPSDVTLTDAIVRTNLGEQENPRHAVPTETRPDEVLRDVRSADHAQAIRERSARGPDGLPQEASLLADLREQPGGDPARQSQVEGATDHAEGLVSGVRQGRAAARTSPRPESGEQRPGEPRRAVCLMPPVAPLAGGSRGPCGCNTGWGQYEAAIRRWERVLGHCAPPPTQHGPKGRPRLDARFSEFMMGLPAGWVTDVPGITRKEALRALGNGVVPQQAEAAVRFLLAHLTNEVAA